MECGVIIMIASWCCDTLKLCSVACTSLPLIPCVNVSIMVMHATSNYGQTMGKFLGLKTMLDKKCSATLVMKTLI